MSVRDFRDLFFTKKNAITAPTTRMEITIPAMAPPLTPDFFPPLPELLVDGFPFPLGWRFRFPLPDAGEPGGGGGAFPEFHEFPSFLLYKFIN